jgi:hypothetical protein
VSVGRHDDLAHSQGREVICFRAVATSKRALPRFAFVLRLNVSAIKETCFIPLSSKVLAMGAEVASQ